MALTAIFFTRVGTTRPALLIAHLRKSLPDPPYELSTCRKRSSLLLLPPPVAAAALAGTPAAARTTSRAGVGADHVGIVQPSMPHSRAFSASGSHFSARDHLRLSRFEMPLMSTVARPRSTSSCGKEAMAFRGDESESSAAEKPPGISSSASPKSSSASAAAASGGASSTKVTPKSAKASLALETSAGEPPVVCHSRTSSSASAILSRSADGNCFTWPQSIRATCAPSMTKMLPGCGSPWIKPAPRIIRPKASVSCVRMRRPAIFASGPPGSMPRLAISSGSRLSGVPLMKSMTSTRRDARPCTGRGTATAGSASAPSTSWLTEANTFIALCASWRKSSSPWSARSSSQKTV
mmetsp:Transcript_3068/g.6413  ORF Transcript_3068/g.6413 Transcript_3068/m.6413 type:complete len:352 (+) Transcript_3068:228-1283(+)